MDQTPFIRYGDFVHVVRYVTAPVFRERRFLRFLRAVSCKLDAALWELLNPLEMEFCTKRAIVFAVALLPHLSAQQITARYYPEKQHYLVSEPIIVVYEFVNNGPKAVMHSESNCRQFSPNKFEVDNAPLTRTIELYG